MHLENQIIQSFTGKSALSETTDDAWNALVEKYPAFNLGYYFRAKRHLLPENSDAPEILRQAALHFNDIRWLDYLLKTVPASDQQNVEPERPSSGVDNSVSAATPEKVPAPAIAGEKNELAKADNEAGRLSPQNVLYGTQPGHQTDEPEDNTRLSAVLSAQLADFKKPVGEDARLEVDREPLYKVDYFASQGISVLKNQDGFDKKVRRFTDWLKEMKQQSADTAGPQLHTTPQEEAQAAEKAEKSLKIEPVWTESMAEVLLSQGKEAQAREVYQKLSLLYPEKSTYFASKIDLLQ